MSDKVIFVNFSQRETVPQSIGAPSYTGERIICLDNRLTMRQKAETLRLCGVPLKRALSFLLMGKH